MDERCFLISNADIIGYHFFSLNILVLTVSNKHLIVIIDARTRQYLYRDHQFIKSKCIVNLTVSERRYLTSSKIIVNKTETI